jgi:uncharacterized membrane protein
MTLNNLNQIGQMALMLAIWGTVIYLAIVGRPIPDVLLAGGATIIGFYFGAGVERQVASRSG